MKHRTITGYLALAVAATTGCGADGDPADALTRHITFANGSREEGPLPPPTNRADDPVVTGSAGVSSLGAGAQGQMQLSFEGVPPGQDFDVLVQFGDAGGHHRIPISPSLTGGASSGTLGIPFMVDSDVCSDLESIQHQIECYETVSVGGVQVSKAVAMQIVLDCEEDEADEAESGGGGVGQEQCSAAATGAGCDIQSCARVSNDGSVSCWYVINGSQRFDCAVGCDCYAAAQDAVNSCDF